jgi:MoaA/NifB/PqqE/SkfB family radical SAM enzyme
MFHFNELNRAQLEITNNCQASCPMCARISNGMQNPNLVISSWTLDEYKKIMNDEVLHQLKEIEFCGNFGDPVMNNDLLDMCRYTRDISSSVNIIIKTNGGIRNASWWYSLSKILKENSIVVFAIDGLKDTNHIYRKGTDFDKIIENAVSFIGGGGYAVWDMLVFQHNEHQVEAARELSQSIGFKQLNVKGTSRFIETEEGTVFPVNDNKGNFKYNLRPGSSNPIKFVDKKLLENYKTLSTQVTINCQVKNTKEIYIDSHKHIYPCCFTGKVLYNVTNDNLILEPFLNDRLEQFKLFIKEFGGLGSLDTHLYGIKNIIDSDKWQSLWVSRWQNPDKLLTCAKSCGSFFKEYSERIIG